jgi:hypothetical protein
MSSLELIWSEKNLKALNFINDFNIMLNYNKSFGRRLVTLSKDDIELGRFYIDGEELLDMSIYIEEDSNELRGKGLAKLMIGFLIINMVNTELVRKDQLVFIDADASAGFWDKIGMIPNRYYERNKRNVNGGGYEKVITFSKLSKWALGIPLGN